MPGPAMLTVRIEQSDEAVATITVVEDLERPSETTSVMATSGVSDICRVVVQAIETLLSSEY